MSRKIANSVYDESSAGRRAYDLARALLASNESVDLIVAGEIRAGIQSHIQRLRANKTKENTELLEKLEDPDSREGSDLLQRVRNDYLSREMRERIRKGFGDRKAALAYNYMYKRLVTVNRRFTLGLALCKLVQHDEALSLVSNLSSADFIAFVDLLDGMCNIPEVTEKKLAEHQSRRERAFAASAASLPEKILKKFLPDATQGDMTGAMMNFVKEKMNFSGKENQHTDDVCMDMLLASPFNNLLMFFAASVTGNLGLMVMMLPLYLTWTIVSGMKSVTCARSDIADANNPTTGSQFTKLLTDSDSNSILTRRISSVERSGFVSEEEHKRSNVSTHLRR